MFNDRTAPKGSPASGSQRDATIYSDSLALKLVHRRRGGEAYAIVQAIHIDHCANTLRHLGDCGDEDATTTTDEEIARPGAESVAFNQRPRHPPGIRRIHRGQTTCAGYGCGRTSKCSLGSDCPPVALSAEVAHECCRSGIRPDGPCR
jgi:hypothetical protein